MTDHAEPNSTDSVVSTPDQPCVQVLASGFAIQYTPERQPRRQVRYEPRTHADGWWRIVDEWTGCAWRVTDREPVADIQLTIHHD
ncbi:hypothetical protein DOS48_05135 [Halorubrum sp. PV6]|nr:hypothetical protein DOS48_05135 [Halorubrum sp. PV6]